MENSNNSRWWETYLVRYITGSVVGAVIVYQILIAADVSKAIHPPQWHELKAEALVMLGLVGFAYCYLASAPITFLHAIRVGGEGTSYANILLPMMLIASVPVLLMFLMNPIAANTDSALLILFIVVAFIWMLFNLNLVKYRGWAKSYDDLVSARNNKLKRSAEFVDSYRHLREHGNAFYIVILELMLAMPLYVFALHKNWFLFVVTISIWLIPGAICWYLGNALESFMTKEYLSKMGRNE